MQYGVLGPLEMSEGGRPVELTGGKPRALLAVLLLHANRVVSVDSLVDALWEDEPPETAAKALQVHVSHLRKVLGRDRLVTKPPGYLLRVEPDELDVARAEQLARERRFGEALSLWRGQPLAEFAGATFARPEIARLDEWRIGLLEQRIEADLDAGHEAGLVAELEALVAEHPLRQRLRGQLMLALYRSGREAEALEAYQAARRQLVEELGIEPRRELRELQQAILRQDPELDLGVKDVAEAEGTRTVPFVGRETELMALRTGLDEAFSGQGRLFLLVGEPGIGKSRLAEEVTREADARGARILVGRCWEAGGAPPYWPWLQALRAYVRDADTQTLGDQLGPGASDLGQLLPELHELYPDLPQPSLLDVDSARFRLFESAATFLRAVAESRPLVLFLDDLHAADEPSLLLLRFVARELGASRVFVLGACRDIDPGPSEPLATTIAELAREPVARVVALKGLSEPDVARFVELTANDVAGQDFAAMLFEETGGNPLFVGEIVRLLAAEGRLEQTEGRFAIPQGVRDVIARRLRRLSDECNRVLLLASVLGREFAPEVLAHLADVSEDALFETLDEAMSARAVADLPGGHGRLRFAHVLIRDTLYDGLTTARRIRLHRLAIRALEASYGEDAGGHLAELAHHALCGSAFAGAYSYARRAGALAQELLAFEEAARLFSLALDALELSDPGDLETRCDLTLALADAVMAGGDASAAKQTFLRAAEIARSLPSPERLASAALGYTGRGLWGPRAEADHALVPLLEDALVYAGDDDSVLRARLLARLASTCRGDVDRERPKLLADRGVEIATRIGQPETLLYALGSRVAATRGPANIVESGADGAKIVDLARELGAREYEFSGRENLVYVAWTLGDRESVESEFDAMRHLATRLRQPALRWSAGATGVMLALTEGRLDDAEELIEEVFLVGERSDTWIAVASHRLQTFALRELRGDLEGYQDVLRSCIRQYPGYKIFECALASACSRLGLERETRAVFGAIAAADFHGLSRDEDWLVNVCLLSDVAVMLGDAARAATLYRQLAPYESLNAFASAELDRGPVARNLGCLAAMLGRGDQAARHYEAALTMCARMQSRPWLARTQEDYADLLRVRDAPVFGERARELRDAARMTYRELGMTRHAERCEAALVRS